MSVLVSVFKNKNVNNGIYMYVLQAFNTIVPMITLPYILRIFGPGEYGVFALALNIASYVSAFIEYGFDYTGVKQIAVAKTNEELSYIISKITSCKLILFVICFLTFLLFNLIVVLKSNFFLCLFIFWGYLFAIAIQQLWVFQGMGAMKYITYANVISRIVSVALIFTLIENNGQIVLYTFLYTISIIVSSIISVGILYFKFKFRFRIPTITDIYEELERGRYIFWTRFCTKIFSGFNITVLGFFAGTSDSGVFAALQKIATVEVMIFSPISTVLFPYMSKKFSESFFVAIKTIRKLFLIVMLIFSLISVFIGVYSEDIIALIYGDKYFGYQKVVYILLVWILFSIANNFLGIQILVAAGYDRIYNKCFNISLVFLITFSILGGYFYKLLGVAWVSLIAEMILTASMAVCISNIYIQKQNDDH